MALIDEITNHLGPNHKPELEPYIKATEITLGSELINDDPVITLNGTRICSQGGLMFIVAPPGSGKSQLCEMVAGRFLNPYCDAINLKIDLPESKKCLLLDTERTRNDCIKGFQRIIKRVDTQTNPELIEGDRLRGFSFLSLKGIAKIENRKSEVEKWLKVNECGLVIVDCSTDFIANINDPTESVETVAWLDSLATQHNLALVATIHDNPKDHTGKPRGHFGSEAYRKCESMFHLRRETQDKSIRTLTTEFEHGKVRNAMDSVGASFTWSNEAGMFMPVDYDPPKRSGKSVDYEENFYDTFQALGRSRLSHKTLLDKYMELFGKAERTAKRHIADAKKEEILSIQNGLYYMPGKDLDKVTMPF